MKKILLATVAALLIIGSIAYAGADSCQSCPQCTGGTCCIK